MIDNEKHRIEWVKAQLKSLPPNLRILDAGAGEQQYKQFCEHLDYVSQDFADYNPSEMPSGLQMEKWEYGTLDIVCDITAIPEPDASFDVILCTEVFEHIPDPIRAIKEFSRLLKKGGTLILTAPFCSMTHFAPYHFYTGFNRFFYEKHLPDHGFELVETAFNGDYFSFVGQEINRLPYVAEKYTSVRMNLVQRTALKIIARFVNKNISTPNTSTELLSFGLHIVAKKK